MSPETARWIRNPSDELAVEAGCYFDERHGRFCIEFIESHCRQSKGRKWAGEALKLLEWQRDFLMRLFGWRRADGRRRFTKAYLEVAKKNGKSTMLSALVLFLLLFDDRGPEVYCNACNREQAAIIFGEAVKMIKASPALARRLKIVDSDARKRIVDPKGNGVIIANAGEGESEGRDGLNPSATLFDELHRQKGRALWDVFEYAGAARDEPLRISITTAGEDELGIWHEERELSEKINAGVIPDITHLGVVYRALPEDDIDDPATWTKANPSLGHTISFESFREDLQKAKETPRKLALFRRLRLNIITRADQKFIDLARWDEGKTPVDPEALEGRPCYGGADLSATTDLTAAAFVFPAEDGTIDVLARFYLPEEDIVELERKDKVPYRRWAELGYLTLTPGPVVDYGFIREDVKQIAARFDLVRMNIDAHNATHLVTEMIDEDGQAVEFMPQGFLSMNGPTKELQRLILAGRIRHGADPILRWNISNAVASTDEHLNIKLSKKKSRLKIDGAVALVNAIAAAMKGDGGGSAYTGDRGLMIA